MVVDDPSFPRSLSPPSRGAGGWRIHRPFCDVCGSRRFSELGDAPKTVPFVSGRKQITPRSEPEPARRCIQNCPQHKIGGERHDQFYQDEVVDEVRDVRLSSERKRLRHQLPENIRWHQIGLRRLPNSPRPLDPRAARRVDYFLVVGEATLTRALDGPRSRPSADCDAVCLLWRQSELTHGWVTVELDFSMTAGAFGVPLPRRNHTQKKGL